MLYEMMYISKAVEGVTKAEIKKIVEISVKNNKTKDITGMLVYRKNEFIQLLEGDQKAVLELYEKIAKDPRHESIFLIYKGEIKKRECPDWAMSYVDLDLPDNLAHLADQYQAIMDRTKKNMEERFKDGSLAKRMFVELAYKERGL